MNLKKNRTHSVDSLFSFLLFGLFVLFLLILLLFSAQLYQSSVQSQDENQNLHTAAIYLETKFRQHDSADHVYTALFNGLEALAFEDVLDGTACTTYIYLLDGELRELFTVSGSTLLPDAGTVIAELSGFRPEQTEDGFLSIRLTDGRGAVSELIFHPGTPENC